MVKEEAREEAKDWPKALKNNHIKEANYIVVEDTVLINGKTMIPTNLWSQILQDLHRSHGGANGIGQELGRQCSGQERMLTSKECGTSA